jgi:Spy/CpxP family protein refolding chaperone
MMKAMAWLVVLAGAAAPLAAQQHPAPRGMAQGGMMHGDMMPGMDSMMAPMMRAMAYAPQHLLRQKDALHLTSDQVTQLTSLGDAAKTAHDAAAQQAQMHLGEMEQVMQAAAPDTAAVKHHFEAAHRLMGEAMWAMMAAAAQGRAVLTDAQRTQVDAMAKRPMWMRHGGMGQHGEAGH